MPVDDRDDAARKGASSESQKQNVSDALQSKTDEPLPPAAERLAERDADRPEPVTPQGQRRRWLTRRNAFLATLAIAAGLVLIIILLIAGYKLGYVDRYVAGQIKDTLAQYGIRAEIKEFHTAISPRTVEMRGIELYDQQTGAQVGRIERMLATVRIEDLYALNLRRNVNLESLVIDNPELWVAFDEQGNSNFRNFKLPPPDPNSRILFSYSTASIKINGGVVHYGDKQHDLSGEARQLALTIQPDDPNAPAESWMNTVNFSSTNSTLTYDGRPAINNIDVTARGRVNQTRAEIQELTLRSPLAEARLQGTMDDWRNLHYKMQVNSTVDLTQASDILQTGTALRGVGNFNGSLNGEGDRYEIDGQIKSDALAADNIRLRALNVTARGTGQGKTYDMNGKAVAELLTAGDFQLNTVQLAGGVMGTGTDFRFLGDLRAAAARYAGTASVANLILSDVVAESRDNTLVARVARAFAGGVNTAKANLGSVQASDLRLRNENGVTNGSAASVQAGTINASGARINGLTASGIDFVDRDGTTNIVSDNLRVGGINASGAQVGSLNIAGVRLAIHAGRIQGSSGDINAGTVNVARSASFAGGRVENVRLAHPVFTLEPSGSYRASADLSLGGGVLGQVNLGAARAALLATNNQVQLNNFNADIMGGRATGNATIALSRGGASRVASEFADLDIGKLASLVSGRAVPVAGKATGTVDLAFPGTDFGAASGSARAEFTGETGDEASGRTPLTGSVALTATRGLFNIERANLRTAASELNASGQFALDRADSNLQLNLTSTDASELQRVLVSSGLFPDVEDKLSAYGIELAGNLSFNGTIRGKLDQPEIDGRATLASLLVNGRDAGALALNLNSTPTQLRITDGRLTQPDGGGVQFTLNAPFAGTDNIALDATLDRVNSQNLLAIISGFKSGGVASTSTTNNLSSIDINSPLSGRINVTGIPNAMNGNADLRFGAGTLRGEQFESIIARATFNGSNINLETVDAHFNAGHLIANGTYNTTTNAFDLQARGEAIQLDRLTSLAGRGGAAPQLAGTATLNARATGIFTDFSTYQVDFNGEGRDVLINGSKAGTLSLVGRTENKQLNITFTTGLLGQPQVIAARVDLGSKELATTIETTLTGADLTPLFAAILPGTDVKVTGHATGTLRASGNLFTKNEQDEDVFGLGGLQGKAEFTDLTLQIQDIQLTAVSPLLVQFSPKEIFFEKTEFKGRDRGAETDIVFGGTAALGPGGRQNLTIDGRLNLQVLNTLSPNIFSTGVVDTAVRIGGTYEQPRITGTASVDRASISTLVGDQRLTLANVKGSVRFNANQAQIDSLTGTLGGGRVSATGGVLLEGFALSRFTIAVNADNVVVPFPENFRSTADANLEIRGSQREQIISGTVNLRRAEYTQNIELADIINRRKEASLTEGGGGDEGGLGSATILDHLLVVGRDALVVRNNLADVVGSVSLELNGPVEDPIISGRITATRGTLSFRNDRYELTRAFIDLPGRRDADPVLNIQAESEIRGYRVIVGLTGPLSQPQAVVRSDPSLPQADVVSLITTGDLSTGETGTSTLAQSGIGTATSLLTDTLINAPAQRATSKLFGLSRFEIDPLIAGRGGSSPTARLTVGRQINKNLSITYSTNLTSDQNQVLALEYRVSNRLSFVAQYQQGSVSGFTTRNNNFSFEIRFHKRF
jgi:translocation and assembly module TamB